VTEAGPAGRAPAPAQPPSDQTPPAQPPPEPPSDQLPSTELATDLPTEPAAGATEDSGRLIRASGAMAVGTVFSRGTGFLRVVVVAAALGAGHGADAYNVANVLPNIVYELLLGGVLTSVVVPVLAAAARRDPDRGDGYAARLLTLVAGILGLTSLLAAAGAPLLIRLYGEFGPAERDLAVIFARFFLPQILFYGVGATIGAVLNVRGRFAAPMWAPVLNNLVVIGAVLYFRTLPPAPPGELLTTAQTLTLAIGTTAGIVVQTLALWPSLRRTGFRWRPRLDLRGSGLGGIGPLAGWVLVYVAVNQLGFLVVVRLATAASEAAHSTSAATGFSPYFYAFSLFSVPYAVVAVSVITALLPRMSRHAVDGQLPAVRSDLARALRLAAVVLVPASVTFVVLGPLLGVAVFNNGSLGVADARQTGLVLTAYSVGLLPFSGFQLQLRAFYAVQDTRTPALINVVVNAVMVVADLGLYAALPPHQRVIGLALGHSASYLAGFALTNAVLDRRLPNRRREHVLRTHLRLLVAAVLAVLPAYVVAQLLAGNGDAGAARSRLAVAVALPLIGGLFVTVARRLRVAEVGALAAALPFPRHRV